MNEAHEQTPPKGKPQRNKWKIIVWVVFLPILLFFLLSALIYFPPFQRFLVNKLTDYAQEEWGITLCIEKVSLSFPLDLSVHNALAMQEKDTLFTASEVVLDVEMLPLVDGILKIERFHLKGTTIHTAQLIDGIELKAQIEQLKLYSKGISFPNKQVVLDDVSLSDAQVFLHYADTTAQDTTEKTPTNWKISLPRVALSKIKVAIDMPLDSMRILSSIDQAVLTEGHLDLLTTTFTARKITLNVPTFALHSNTEEAKEEGIDVAHIRLQDFATAIDTFYYSPKKTSFTISQLKGKEHSGIAIEKGKAHFYMDSTQLQVKEADILTTDSRLSLEAIYGMNESMPLSEQRIDLQLLAEIGQGDIYTLFPELKKSVPAKRPTAPLKLQMLAQGNKEILQIPVLDANMAHTIVCKGKGEVYALTDEKNRRGKFSYTTQVGDLSFLAPLMGNVHIPQGLSIQGDIGVQGEDFTASAQLMNGDGKALFKASYNLPAEAYQMTLSTDRLNLVRFLPADSLYYLTSTITAQGKGLDFTAAPTGMETKARVDYLLYGSRELTGISLDATLHQNKLVGGIAAHNKYMEVDGWINAQITTKESSGKMDLEVKKLDWYALHLIENPFATSQHLTFDFYSDMKTTHSLTGDMTVIRLITPEKTYPAKDIHIGIGVAPDTTNCFAYAGDLAFVLTIENDLQTFQKNMTQLQTLLKKQWEAKQIDQQALCAILPKAEFNILSGKDNPLYNFLATKHIYFDDIDISLKTSSVNGINGYADIKGLRTDSLWIDNINVELKQVAEKLTLKGGVNSVARPKQEAFNVLLNGEIASTDAFLRLQYLNGKKETGADIGFRALLEQEGIRFKLLEENPTLVYRKFQANSDNFIFLSSTGKIEAQLKLHDDKYSGLEFFSMPNETALQDLTLALHRIDIGEFRRIIPYMPNISGVINSEFHYVEEEKDTHISTDMSVNGLTYDNISLGNWAMSAVYLPKEAGEHKIDGFLSKDGEEVAQLNGSYFAPLTAKSKPGISADLTLLSFPLSTVNPFVPEKYAELTGGLNGTLTIAGATDQLLVNGDMGLDKVDLRIPKLSMQFQFDNRHVSITDSRLHFDQYQIHSQGSQPFIVDGYFDIRDFASPLLDLHLSAEDFELVNARKSRDAMVYGRIFVDVESTLRGRVSNLDMRGQLKVLGKSDFTYVMDNTPLTVEDRLGETVKFVSFADTTATENTTPAIALPSSITMLMNIQIDEGVQCRANIDRAGSNYLLLEGGGDLTFQYTKQGDMRLTGRYGLTGGEMKYDLPVIPLKTFYIVNGSYLQWSGDVMNPLLNIKAYERVRASVSSDGQSNRMVAFNVGINISQRLDNMGFTFTLEAPEDGAMQNELAGKSAEEKNKLAVTMLATGMYLSNTNDAGGLTASSALNAFLQSEINHIAGSALKTIDMNFNMESNDIDGDGNAETNYNFQFAKRFWNNRIRIVIGGTVTTGNTIQQESFINNIALEYRLDNGGTRYVKLFHNKNYESILDGEVVETGVGIVLKKRVSKLSELFIFRPKKRKKVVQNENSQP